MIFQIKIADQIIEIHSLCSTVYNISKNYLISSNEQIKPDIVISICDDDILKELYELRSVYAKKDMSVPIVGEGYCESLAVFRKIADVMPAFNTFLMHGAAISKDNQAYLFTADSGVGKTTRAKLWLEQYPDSFIINGDKPLIKITDTDILVCGTPWCGKEGWNTNTMVPLKAIFFLERAENKPDHIYKVDFNTIFPFLLKQIHRPKSIEYTLKTLNLLNSLDGKVGFFKFQSSRSLESIRLAYCKGNQ